MSRNTAMDVMNIFKRTDINTEVENYKSTENAVLLDVRTTEEYKSGHIPGSINVPVDDILNVRTAIPDHNVPIFVYCLGGSRAAKAVNRMKALGYTDVRNIGGISKYSGMKAI